jgi:ketosteroid isomerase-like protein
MSIDHEAFARGFLDAVNRQDWDAVDAMVTDDIEEIYPQSGEVIRGRANTRAVRENYPRMVGQGADVTTFRISPSEPAVVMTRMFTLVRVEGTGNTGTIVVRIRYPGDSYWWLVGLYELRDGRMARITQFFAQEFPPPEWRRQWVEISPAPPPAPD